MKLINAPCSALSAAIEWMEHDEAGEDHYRCLKLMSPFVEEADVTAARAAARIIYQEFKKQNAEADPAREKTS